MKEIKKLMFYYSITSLHMGSGSKLGPVDQPIQREVHTNFPLLPSSGIKGGFREIVEAEGEKRKEDAKKLFGRETEGSEGASTPGVVTFTDARILFFPVKSLFGVFAWITSPSVLNRLKEDLRFVGMDSMVTAPCDFVLSDGEVIRCGAEPSVAKEEEITLESFTFKVKEPRCSEVNGLLKKISEELLGNGFDAKLMQDVVIVSDDTFKYFVENSTEIVPRIKIGESGTVSSKGGNFWYEENVPPQAIFYSMVLLNPALEKNKQLVNQTLDGGNQENPGSEDENEKLFKKYIDSGYIQLGGNQTIGRGFLRYKVIDQPSKEG